MHIQIYGKNRHFDKVYKEDGCRAQMPKKSGQVSPSANWVIRNHEGRFSRYPIPVFSLKRYVYKKKTKPKRRRKTECLLNLSSTKEDEQDGTL